jgi:hypothetical protein
MKMFKRLIKSAVLLTLIIFTGVPTFAQNGSDLIPDSLNGLLLRGEFDNIARGVLDGNLIESNFRNHGELSRWNDIPWGVWPRGVGGRHIDGIGVVVAAKVPGVASDRVNTFQEYLDIISADGFVPDTTLNPVIINYRDFGKRLSDYTDSLYGWLPLPGFNNPNRVDPNGDGTGVAPVPALSNDQTSWPELWPDRLNQDDPGWPGTWNGRDGRLPSADLESYYVMDDYTDFEYAVGIETDGPHSNAGVYHPSPYEDPSKGGLGLQMKVRIFQWANILAEDAMFIIYNVTNRTETEYDSLYFSQIVDYGLGNEENDDNAAYDAFLDLVYGWDTDGLGDPTGGQTQIYELGYTGFAFLESPGNDTNLLDDDQDGIIDENRFSENYLILSSQSEIDAYVGANYDAVQFELFYGESYQDRDAYKAERWFTTDENLDWVGYNDANQNGIWDAGETLNNDIGSDGLGPFDLNYPGPDTGEGDGLPTDGEPNYNKLDVDESDQIGLTGFDLDTRPNYEAPDQLDDDTWLFSKIDSTHFRTPGYVEPSTVADNEPFVLFTSGEVELFPEGSALKSTDRFSTAWIFGEDEQDFFKNRRTVQSIYNADYSFAQPPNVPTLTAVAGDEQVILSWDTLSLASFDRFLQEFDFEGYKLYKGTDNLLSDARTISDVNGTPTFYEPIAQWDLDNNISGITQVLDGDALYNLGDNTGLQFYYVDNNVTNGKVYYYVIVAYDRGVPGTEGGDPGIYPQENTFRIAIDGAGFVAGTSSNAAVVVPTPMPAGFVEGGSTTDLSSVTSGSGTGYATVNIVVDAAIDEDKLYEVTFTDTLSETGYYRLTENYRVRELTEDEVKVRSAPYEGATSIIDGFTVNFVNDAAGTIIPSRTGWVSNEGEENELFNLDATELDGMTTEWEVAITPDRKGNINNFVLTDYDYEFEFVDPNVDGTYRPPRNPSEEYGKRYSRLEVPLFARNVNTGQVVDYLILDWDDSGDISVGDELILSERNLDNRLKYQFAIEFFGADGAAAPAPGEKFRISTTRAFGSDDAFQFAMRANSLDDDLAGEEMEDIYVVPNPYIGGASWERANTSIGRGERRIEFFNLPSKCTVRIFNVRGELIRTLEHDGGVSDGSLSWDLRTNDSEDVAYGIYFYHVEAPGVGEFVDKFAIIK